MATSVINVGGQRVGVQVIPSAQASVSVPTSLTSAWPGGVGTSKVSEGFRDVDCVVVWFRVT